MTRIAPAVLTLGLLSSLACSISGITPPQSGTLPAESSTAEKGVDSSLAPTIELLTVASPQSPLIALRLLFRAGSIYDPPGKEGLAALTALMLGQAGTEVHSYTELIDALYPMAASVDVMTDREVTAFSGEIHGEKLAAFSSLLTEIFLRPAFDEGDFARNKQQLESYLENTLRASSDELLGLEAIQQVIFRGHPYGHSPSGTLAGLAAITIDDVKAFYRKHYTRRSLILGVSGGYPENFPQQLAADLSALPPGSGDLAELPKPHAIEGRNFLLIEKPTRSVGIHLGFPLSVNRAHPDFYPLMVANSFLGEHRTFHGRLMQQLRGKRGLNYGDYSYIEHWHLPPFTSNPTPNVPRRQQFFSIWVRPVEPSTAHFALRNALYELDRLIERGMTEDEVELTRSFLVNYSKLWAQTLSDRLGFLMDSSYYGMDSYIDEIATRLSTVTASEVNAAVRRHLQSRDFQAVFVTDNAVDMMNTLAADDASPLPYNSPPEPDVLEADKTIERLPVAAASIAIAPIDQMFEGTTIGQ